MPSAPKLRATIASSPSTSVSSPASVHPIGSTASAGGMRNSGLPIRSQDALWNQAASASTKAIFISSLGCQAMPPRSSQRCAPLAPWPIFSTSMSNTTPPA